jgi:hypothetical protein
LVPARHYCSAVVRVHKNQNENTSCSRKSRIGSISFSKHNVKMIMSLNWRVGLAISVSGSLRYFQQKLLPANVAIPWLAIPNECEENKIQLAEYAGVSIQKDLLIYCGCCRNVMAYNTVSYCIIAELLGHAAKMSFCSWILYAKYLNISIAGGPWVRPNQQLQYSSSKCHVIVPQNLSSRGFASGSEACQRITYDW